MKRLGLKISSIILTIISILLIIFFFMFMLEAFNEMVGAFENSSTEDAGDGLIAIMLFFFVIATALFFVFSGIGFTSLASIILNSIDLSKTIKDNDNIAFNITMLSINFLLYTFVVGLITYALSR